MTDAQPPADAGAEKWEEAAKHTAATLSQAVESLGAHLEPGGAGPRHDFWNELRGLQEAVRVAAAIRLDDKFALQRKLRVLAERGRALRKAEQDAADALKASLIESLALLTEEFQGAESSAELGEVRADLVAFRERLDREGRILDRSTRDELWTAWQRLNGETWGSLNARWEDGAKVLSAILDEARDELEQRRPGPARDRIKAFHAAIPEHQCSHRALRELRGRAGALWQEAQEQGRQKHEEYLRGAARRVENWKRQLAEIDRRRAVFLAEIPTLERESATATTAVAAALLRGRLEERHKALRSLDNDRAALEQRIAATEEALAHP